MKELSGTIPSCYCRIRSGDETTVQSYYACDIHVAREFSTKVNGEVYYFNHA